MLVLIDDLIHSFQEFPLGSYEWKQTTRNKCNLFFKNHLSRIGTDYCMFETHRSSVESFIEENQSEFLITLDRGIICKSANYEIDVNRIALTSSQIRNGPYSFCARIDRETLENQFDFLASELAKHSDKNTITLFDDSVGNHAITMKFILLHLKRRNIAVDKILVLSAPTQMRNIENVPIVSFFERDTTLFSFRDFFLGFQRSGITCYIRDLQFGWPIWIDEETMSYRLNLFGDHTIRSTRALIIENELSFWRTLEDDLGRSALFNEVPRIRHLPLFLDKEFDSVLQFIERISGIIPFIENHLELDFDLPATVYNKQTK